ncbi:hypothetical protein FSP39_005175 [Pinctada imbricata]|uniref:Uncharacterized protein n=1 Tax=Pinctada imbricata TaxID=66713 RepID=A0AA88Y6Q8_PINIB|nr:hypothetical protein FSP39_005175 [Pinctada imbricata]
MSLVNESEAKKLYAHMLDDFNQHLIDDNLKTFKTNVAEIHGVPPKPLATNHASDIIKHLDNKNIITFIPSGKKRKVDFDGLIECLKTESLGSRPQEMVYDYWTKINKALGLPSIDVPAHTTKQRHSLGMHRQCTEKSDFTDHGGDGGLERHRKTTNNAAPYESLKPLFVDSEQSIGLVRCHRDDKKVDRGTAYRVGTKYIMTAYHNFKNKIESMWTFIFQRLHDQKYSSELSGKWTSISKALDVKDNGEYVDSPEAIRRILLSEGVWYDSYRNVSELMTALEQHIGPSNTGELEKEIKDYFKEKCDIRFNYTEERFASEQGKGDNSSQKEFVFQCNIPFGSRVDDVLILELTTINPEQAANFPRRFKLKYQDLDTDLKTSAYIHIFGHPDGKVLQVDLQCHLLTMDDKEDIDKNKVNFWTKFTSGMLTESDVEMGYKGFMTDVDQRLFHVSQSTAHGASGAPCLIVDGKTPVVLVMLLGGYPKFFYNALSKKQQESKDLDPKYLIESGIPMSKVSKLLRERNLIDLHDDIFRSDVDDKTIGWRK